MTYFQALFLAIVQGLTEFLPVSSSGHLVIFQKLFGLRPPVLFDILVHVGTLGAILFYFKSEFGKTLRGLIQKEKESWQICWLVIIGTIPAVVVGLVLQGYLEKIFDSLVLVGISLLITSGLLFSTKWFKQLNRQFNQLKWRDGFLIGCFQALAILPGISRSGATIVSGLWRKLGRETALQFSFYLAVPAILGALTLQIPELVSSSYASLDQALLGMVVAAIVGYGALKILEKILLQAGPWLFGIYCLVLGMMLTLLNTLV